MTAVWIASSRTLLAMTKESVWDVVPDKAAPLADTETSIVEQEDERVGSN